MAVVALALGLCAGCAEEDPLDFGGPRDCTLPEQNAFMYLLMQEAYLWNEHVPDDVDPAAFESPSALVTEVRYSELDRWSRVSDLATSDALFEEGMVIGIGFRTRRTEDNRVLLGFVDPLSPAGLAGLKRGDELVGAGGFTNIELDESDGWTDALGPNEPGIDVQLEVATHASTDTDTEPRSVSLTKDWYPLVTVPLADVIDHEGTPVGYLFFTTFVEPSIDELSDAFARFEAAGVRNVVVDMRYNGGGRISAARHLVDLLVGAQASGEISYRTDYTPSLAEANSTRHIERQSSSLPALDHVVFITTGSTASASELVINAVRPWAPVSVVGSPTAGKPVGSAQFTFCDKAANPITFRLLNARDEGDYFDGFATDCDSPDDLGHQLGDPQEASMAAALARLDGAACPTVEDSGDGDGEVEGEAELGPSAEIRTRPAGLPGAYPGIDALRGTY
ncbi:MAG: S41 family peptidase [Nannocystales bacterium]